MSKSPAAIKIRDYGGMAGSSHDLVFHCPGCGNDHSFAVPRWTWNNSFTRPTFRPSLLLNSHDPKSRCHLFVTEGRIEFLPDCWHTLAGATVDLPDWESFPA